MLFNPAMAELFQSLNNIKGKNMISKLLKSGVVLILASAMGLSVLADGMRNPPEGMTGLGKVGGKIVYNDDATTVTHNPANLVEQTESSVIVSLTYGYGTKEFTDAAGRSSKTTDNSSVLPNVFLALPINEDLVAGVGITTPYGRSTTFDKTEPLFSMPPNRYGLAYFTELYAVNFNPSIAYRVSDSVSIAGGIDILYSELELKQIYPWLAPDGMSVLSEGDAKLTGDGEGIGYNVALTWNVNENQKAAVTYRSSTEIDYDGDYSISGRPPFYPVAANGSIKTEIEFPAVLALGYGVQVTDRLRIEANVEWIEHSSFDKLDVNTPPGSAIPDTTTDTNWEDNWTYGVGADYVLDEKWTLRAGFIYLETPIPSETITPAISEEDQTVLSIGFGYQNGDHRIDAAYAIGFFNGRTVGNNDNPTLNGDYDFESHLVGISYGRAL